MEKPEVVAESTRTVTPDLEFIEVIGAMKKVCLKQIDRGSITEHTVLCPRLLQERLDDGSIKITFQLQEHKVDPEMQEVFKNVYPEDWES